MATTTATLNFYNSFLLNLAKNINLSTDTLKIGLVTSTYTPDASSHTILSDITNELSGNGYARQTLAGVSLTESGGVVTLDFNDPVFSASGGSFTARRYFIFDDTVATPNKPLIGFGLLDDNNLDVTVTDGNTLTINVNISGFLTITEV